MKLKKHSKPSFKFVKKEKLMKPKEKVLKDFQCLMNIAIKIKITNSIMVFLNLFNDCMKF